MTKTQDVNLILTKYLGQFVGDEGEKVNYEYIEIEFAPNCFSRFKFNENNKRVLQKYAPNMYQLLSNIDYGYPVQFSHSRDDIEKNKGKIAEIYKDSENTENEL